MKNIYLKLYVAEKQRHNGTLLYEWLLEEAKLKRMPAEMALDRQIVVVVGAGSGIGLAESRVGLG